MQPTVACYGPNKPGMTCFCCGKATYALYGRTAEALMCAECDALRREPPINLPLPQSMPATRCPTCGKPY